MTLADAKLIVARDTDSAVAPVVTADEIEDILTESCEVVDDDGYEPDDTNWGGYGQHHKQVYRQTPLVGDPWGWHTYGLLWEPDGVRFYVDGKETFRPTRYPVSDNPNQFMRLTCHLMSISAIAAEDAMLVDWVRVWRQSS